jgi:hypothetical protein
MLLWPRLVCGGTAVPRSSPGLHLPKPCGHRPLAAPGALLVSPFNVKWRFSAPTGGVEGSKLCLFSVIMPAKCVSSVSPRFHYRRLAFCFLPLAAILESPFLIIFYVFSSTKLEKRAEQVLHRGVGADVPNNVYIYVRKCKNNKIKNNNKKNIIIVINNNSTN